MKVWRTCDSAGFILALAKEDTSMVLIEGALIIIDNGMPDTFIKLVSN